MPPPMPEARRRKFHFFLYESARPLLMLLRRRQTRQLDFASVGAESWIELLILRTRHAAPASHASPIGAS